jgi:2,4-dienoyl-CoA reductase (NADPH2)
MPDDRTFPHLLAPGRIGTLDLRNRILMCPMGDSLCNRDGSISPNQAAYFEARAKGGAALLLVGSIGVAYPRAAFDERQVAASDDRYLPGLIDLTTRGHAHGGRIAAQLVHNGQLSLLDVANGRPMLVPSVPKAANPDRISTMVTEAELAAMMSSYTQPASRLEYRVADEADIAEVIEQFVDASERCVRAGFDGIELHAGHGYLIDEFLTPSMNTRTDGWGGAVENRARLLCDILRAVRARVGAEFPVWMRINAVEHHKVNGETFDDQLRVVELALQAGIDAVHVTAYADTDVATGPTDSYAPHVVGSLADYAAAVRTRVDVPVITFGRFEPDEAEQVLAEGKADFVAMGRKLLADPELPNKLAAGRVDDIRPCIYQYRCIGNIFVKESLHCVANAQTGREHDLPAAAARLDAILAQLRPGRAA